MKYNICISMHELKLMFQLNHLKTFAQKLSNPDQLPDIGHQTVSKPSFRKYLNIK